MSCLNNRKERELLEGLGLKIEQVQSSTLRSGPGRPRRRL